MVVLAPIALAHAASFHACLDAVAREGRYLAQWQAPPLDQVQQFVRDSVQADAAQFVALDGDKVVGWCDIFPAWAQAQRHCGRLGMGLLPAFRGQGLGRQLLGVCLAKAWAQGITRVELEARADNAVAIALYRRMGFVHECLKRQALKFGEQTFDAVQMSLLLDASSDVASA